MYRLFLIERGFYFGSSREIPAVNIFKAASPHPRIRICGQELSTDALFHVSVSVKRIFLFQPNNVSFLE